MNAKNDSATADGRKRTFRWKIGAGILVVGALAEAAVWFGFGDDATHRVMFSMPVLAATALGLFIWWSFLSGLSWTVRLVGLLVGIAPVGLVRLDGFRGDMVPNLSWRWSPTSEEIAAAYFADRKPPPTPTLRNAPDSEIAPLPVADADWPGFRGPTRNGVCPEQSIRTDWDARPPRSLWRHPVGLGWSSFAVADGIAFTQEQRGENEVVVAYNVEDGTQVWLREDEARFEESMGGVGPRATPTLYDSRLYTLGATGILNCFEAKTGRLLWSTNILKDAGAENLTWAMAASPLVFDEAVIVNPGGGNGQSVAAYDRKTGKKLWSGGDDPAGYCAPRVETLCGVQQLLIFDGAGLGGHELGSGKLLWKFPWTNGPKVNVAQPIVLDDTSVLIGSGYARGAARVELSKSGSKWTVKPKWTTNRLKMKLSDAVYRDGYVYGLDERILVCVDVETGDIQWKRGRYGYGQILLVADKLLILAEDGRVVLLEASPQAHREIASFQGIEGQTWNHPVLTGGLLLIRNASEAACYDLGKSGKPKAESGGT